DVKRLVGGRELQRLQVGVDGQKLDTLDLGLDHPVDRVDSGPSDADHAQDGLPDHGRRRVSLRGTVGAGVDVPRWGWSGVGALEDVVGNVGRERLAKALL